LELITLILRWIFQNKDRLTNLELSRFVNIIETRAVQKIHSFCSHSYLYFYLVVILTYNRIIFYEILFKEFFLIFHGILLVCIFCMLLFLKGMRGKKYALICVLVF
jgi:hypothetical protein